MRRLPIFVLAASCGTTYGEAPSTVDADAGVDAAAVDAASPDDASTGCSPGSITNGLVAYYPLDEANGTAIKDCSGNGHDGQLLRLGSGTWVTGKRGSAVRVASPEGCMDFGNGPHFRFAGAFTAMAWINVASFPPTANGAILGKSTDLDLEGWRVDSTIVTELGGVVATSSTPLFMGSEGNPTNTWLHLAVVFAPNDKLEAFINGVFAARVTWNGALIDVESTPFRIGCRGDNGAFFDGTIDEVRLYDRELTSAEIAILSTPP